MNHFLTLLFILAFSIQVQAQQRFFAEKSTITFFSDGSIEDIKANNSSVTSIFDISKKEIAFMVKVKDFEFPKKLMQVHFNEKYMESEKYPKSTFVGQVSGFNTSKEGIQHVTAVGKLFIHGVSKEVKIPGTLEKKGPQIVLRSKFMVRLADYNISIPSVIWKNVAEEVEIDLDFTYIPL